MTKSYPKLCILSEEQLWGSSKLSAFDKLGTVCKVTDLAFVSGCDTQKSGSSNNEKVGLYYTCTPNSRWSLVAVNFDGSKTTTYRRRHDGGIRPYFQDESLAEHFIKDNIADDIITVKYGEYPQYSVDDVTASELTNLYKNQALTKTGKHYTFCSTDYNEKFDENNWVDINAFRFKQLSKEELGELTSHKKGMGYGQYRENLCHGMGAQVPEFKEDICEEYVLNNKKYICITPRLKSGSKRFTLSNGSTYQTEDPVWIKVAPVEWYLDTSSKTFISKNILVSGIRYQKQVASDHDDFTYHTFETTELAEYLEKYMAHDIFDIVLEDSDNVSVQDDNSWLLNPYGFDFCGTSEEDIIRGCVESGVPVFLHGKSSEGKSARIKQIDPNCVIIYLRNATPDSLNGKSVFNQATGEMIDIKPTWLQKLENVCNADPENPHILFFDEITNAFPSIQGSAFNIVLDREVNGLWKIPDNARIVGAGNELSDSLAANMLAEPLFNRFAHVYINTELDAWLSWASNINIHPSIYTYIAYKNGDPLRSEFNGQLPNADPRKWEMASKMLYVAKKPEMLRSLVGEDITEDFCEFCKKRMLTVSNILDDKVDVELLDLSKEEKEISTFSLTLVDEENLKTVRDSVKQLGEEYCSIFDSTWTHNIYSRLKMIAELKIMEKSNG